MYPVQINNKHTGDGVLLYGLQGTNFYKEIEKSEAITRKDAASKPDDKIEPFDEFAGLTDFERTLADICIGWIGKEPGWEQYIRDNADVLLRIAIEKFNSVQDASFEQKPVSPATLETKDVNLEEEIMRVSKNEYFDFTDWKSIARHFFELGLKAKGE